MSGSEARLAAAFGIVLLCLGEGCGGCGPSDETTSVSEPLQGNPFEPRCGFEIAEPPSSAEIVGERGRIAISNLGDIPDPFSPAGIGGLPLTTDLSLHARAISTPGGSSGQFGYFVRGIFEIAGGRTCGPINTLVVESPAQAGQTVLLSVTWSGHDGGGVLVQEGEYYYRATVELVRKKVVEDGDDEDDDEDNELDEDDGDEDDEIDEDGDEGGDDSDEEKDDQAHVWTGSGAKIKDRALSEIQAVTAIDPHGVAERPTRELTAQIADIKTRGANYHDLSDLDRACYDATVRARAMRRSQAPVEFRFAPNPDLYSGDDAD